MGSMKIINGNELPMKMYSIIGEHALFLKLFKKAY